MKSYSKHCREQREEVQKKVDLMKPIERLDYFNRVDRITNRFKGSWLIVMANYFLWSSIMLGLFSLLLVSLETTTSVVLFWVMLNPIIKLFLLGVTCLYFSIFEWMVRKILLQKQLNKLNKKYNL